MSREAGKYTLHISKVIGQGADLPPFFGVAHRHFQKALPTVGLTEATLTIPTDLLNMLLPSAILDQIESIEVTYAKGPA